MEDKGRIRKGYHCAWQIHYHIVFPVKYRKVLLDKGIIEILKEIAIGIKERYELEIEAMGMDMDHIHILCTGHPKLSRGQIVRIFKSITAREIFGKQPEVKKEIMGGGWSDGYYVATVGERANWETVEKYIERQGKPQEELK